MLILHGENIDQSRRFLASRLKSFAGEIIKLEGENLNLSELKQAVEGNSLFGKDKLVVIFNIFSRRPSKEKENLLEYLKKEKPKNLIVWEGKKIDGRVLTSFAFGQIRRFDLTPIIFRFLDSLSPQNKKNSLILLHQCLRFEPAEVVFSLLCRQVKDLIIAIDLGKKGLENLPDWKKEKLAIQAKKFGLEKLIKLYQKLLEIDYAQKTGKTPLSLASQLDLLLVNL